MVNIFLFLYIFLTSVSYSKENNKIDLNGFWFECEYSFKTSPPTDNCKMLDDDGFEFTEAEVKYIKNVSSKEINCKKNRVGQCFKHSTKSINVIVKRKNRVKFYNSKLIISFLGCKQIYNLSINEFYVSASPTKKKCFWAGKKIFYIKKYKGKVIKLSNNNDKPFSNN